MRTRKPSRKVVENGIAAAAVAAEAGPAAPIVIPHGRTKRAADQGSFIPPPPAKADHLRQPSFEQPAFQGQVSLARPSSRHQSITPSSTSPPEPAFYTPSSTSPSEPAFSGLASPPSRLNSPAIPPRLLQIDYNELRKAQERISQNEQVAKSQQLVTELQQQLAASQQHVAERDTKLNVIQYQLAQSQKLITEWDTKFNGITQQLTASQQHAAERHLIFERDAEIKENSRATEEDTRDSKELLECVQEQNATLTETINTLREENGNLPQSKATMSKSRP
ncbi:hypothetical protein QBC37DRAFT_381714 [Rhypophila decipiens]|uniref:Uncharacterized protein n=1 Tax=Rhypophila decipiens TaxID=261697 RepID=A0AAN6XSM9_9PEZI|nr:hypothetical protein QBC37DRAFT_381714 [Rhypophila decipiens]